MTLLLKFETEHFILKIFIS